MIARRLLAATPGPWNIAPWDDDHDTLTFVYAGVTSLHQPYEGAFLRADAEFIAHAWADIKALLIENRQLRETVEALEDGIRRERARRR